MKKETWKELPLGCVNVNPGNSRENLTGTWRSGLKPEFIEETCIHCMFCWLFCPHFAIVVEDGVMKAINYNYCTGCGLCAEECPTKPKSIVMVKEDVTLAEGGKK